MLALARNAVQSPDYKSDPGHATLTSDGYQTCPRSFDAAFFCFQAHHLFAKFFAVVQFIELRLPRHIDTPIKRWDYKLLRLEFNTVWHQSWGVFPAAAKRFGVGICAVVTLQPEAKEPARANISQIAGSNYKVGGCGSG